MDRDLLIKVFAEMTAFYGEPWVSRVGGFIDGKPSDRLRISMSVWGRHLANMTPAEVTVAIENLPAKFCPDPKMFIELGKKPKTAMEIAMENARNKKSAIEQKADPAVASKWRKQIRKIMRRS